MTDTLIFQKAIDKSVLYDGINIPVEFQEVLYRNLGFRINRGESRYVSLIIGMSKYTVMLKNINFDIEKYPTHKDLLQIRYSKNSEIAIKLREVFDKTNHAVVEYMENNIGTKKLLFIPDSEKEYLAIYSTPISGELLLDCITNNEFVEETKEIRLIDEFAFESMIDSNSTIVERITKQKFRKLSKAVGENLKQLYGYRCQICGEYVGERYDSHIIHAHHIDYFTKSLNNNSDNIMIVCPNHHGIIHDKNPEFNRTQKEFIYPNGYHEKLKINKHL